MNSRQRHSKHAPCPICQGHPDMPQGKGVRCWGFVSGDGLYIVCVRDEFAGGILPHPKTTHYHHKATGSCRCGTEHAPEDPGTLHAIGTARRADDRLIEVDQYIYQDADKQPVLRVRRLEGGGKKSFRQERFEDGEWKSGLTPQTPDVLFRLPEIIAGIAAGDTIYIVEGEKDVQACEANDLVATTNSGGASKWSDHYALDFAGATVVIVQDKDEPGRKHAREVFAALRTVAKDIRVVEALVGKDAADHFGAKRTVEEFQQVHPLTRTGDPVRWRQVMLDKAQDTTDPLRFWDKEVELPESPKFPSGFGPEGEGQNSVRLHDFRGVAIISGRASSGKTWLALACAVDSALQGWDVLWINAEMPQSELLKRFRMIAGGPIPDNITIVEVGFGATVKGLIELVRTRIGKPKMLTFIDSVSSYIDQGMQDEGRSDDHMGLGPLRYAMMTFINARRLTNGDLSFVLLSEANAAGETKGRFGDHKADLSVNMESDKEVPHLKRVRIVKAWHQAIGPLGLFTLDDDNGRYRRVGD